MIITSDTLVGDVVKQNLKAAPIFHENNIDYCCGGRKSISAACDEARVEPEQLIAQLKELTGPVDPDTAYINNLGLDELADYIVRRHHSYVKENIPFLKASLEKICSVHGNHHPELFEIATLFNESAGELTMHMQKEEIMLFPYIRKMANAKRDGSPINGAVFGSVSNPIEMMMSEHDNEGRRFETIADLSKNYEIPEDACNTYRATLNQLKEFEDDLHRHIHLENNILFPKAIELEKELTKK